VRFRDSTFEGTLIDLKAESTTRRALSLLRTLWMRIETLIILIDTETLNMTNEKAVTEILMIEIKIETPEMIGTETERAEIGIEIESLIEVEIEEITNIESENITKTKIEIEIRTEIETETGIEIKKEIEIETETKNAKEAEIERIDTNEAENQVPIEALHTKDTKTNTLLTKTLRKMIKTLLTKIQLIKMQTPIREIQT
jgi:hypothetical protein